MDVANFYLSNYKKIILWGTGVNPVSTSFDSVYTDMAWVKINRHAAVMETPDLSHYTDMFKDYCEIILIWGEAGIGKTTFCTKLLQDWALVITNTQGSELEKLTADQKRLLGNIGLLVYIALRDTEKGQTLEEVVKTQLFDLIQSDPFELSGNDIVVLCDGLDEVTYTDSPILSIINRKTYRRLKRVVTCRPHASLGISLVADKEIRLKGFNQEQAKHFVQVYLLTKFDVSTDNYEKAWEKIEMTPDLLEMSINPTMLQLLCLLYSTTGKMGEDRASLFRDYTYYLLNQYHFKSTGKTLSAKDLEKEYKDVLVKVGNLALEGLQQSHLQLVFSKCQAEKAVGNVIFKMGFLTEMPSSNPSTRKVQFLHKSLQEYLAAFAVVHGADDEGMQLLMKFCSTSQGLMGSQIILTFVMAMSKKMGKVIQRTMQDLVSSWTSDHAISPGDRTAFLITMLKENKNLEFPLPETLHININEIERTMGKINQTILRLFRKRNVLQRFFGLDSRGVRILHIVIGKQNRLELIELHNLEESEIDFQNTSSDKDLVHVLNIVKVNAKLRVFTMLNTTRDFTDEILQNTEFLTLVDSRNHLRVNILPSEQVTIDKKISQALCKLENLKLTRSDNKIEKMDSLLLSKVLSIMPNQENINIDFWGITVDVDIVLALSKTPCLISLTTSFNTITATAAKELSRTASLQFLPRLQNLDLSYCGISDAACEALMFSLSKNCPMLERLSLSGNKLTSDAWGNQIRMTQLQQLDLFDCGMCNGACESVMSTLSRHCLLLKIIDLSSNHLSNFVWMNHIETMMKLKKLCLYRNPCTKNRELWEEILRTLSVSNPQLTVHAD